MWERLLLHLPVKLSSDFFKRHSRASVRTCGQARFGARWAAQAYRAAAEAGDTLADTLMKELLRDVGAAAGALRQQQDALPVAQVHPPSLIR